MAGDWIKMRSCLDTEPEVFAIADALQIHTLDVVGRLWKLWTWADQHTLNGNAISVTDLTIDRITCTDGFSRAMRAVGWLHGDSGNITLPHFERHNGETAKTRALTANRVRNYRNAIGVTKVTQAASPREEKRREEKNKRNTPPNPLKGERLSRISPPEIADWMAYGDELGMTREEAQKAYDHYSACGWLIGKARKPMRDWRAVCRTAAANAKAWRPNAGLPQHSNGF